MKNLFESVGPSVIMLGMLIFFAVMFTGCDNSSALKAQGSYDDKDQFVAAEQDAVTMNDGVVDGNVVSESDVSVPDEDKVVVEDVVAVQDDNVADTTVVDVDVEVNDEDTVAVDKCVKGGGVVIKAACYYVMEDSLQQSQAICSKNYTGHIASIDNLKDLLVDCVNPQFDKLGGVSVSCSSITCLDKTRWGDCRKVLIDSPLWFKSNTGTVENENIVLGLSKQYGYGTYPMEMPKTGGLPGDPARAYICVSYL